MVRWLKVRSKNLMINLTQVKSIQVKDNAIIVKYNNDELTLTKGADLTEQEFIDLIEYLDGFEKYCC